MQRNCSEHSLMVNTAIIRTLILLIFFVQCNPEPRLWPDGEIPFALSNFTTEEQTKIYECMMLWELASGNNIHFTINERKDIKTLKIIKYQGDFLGASIYYGYTGDPAIILSVVNDKEILHELGHILGLMHEHQRPDRDNYISVLWDNIPAEDRMQFVYMEPDTYEYYHYPYDYNSLMHYDDPYYIDGRGHEIGSSTISIIDALKVKDMYSK
jgi:hypothetical protein